VRHFALRRNTSVLPIERLAQDHRHRRRATVLDRSRCRSAISESLWGDPSSQGAAPAWDGASTQGGDLGPPSTRTLIG
jgi:hypothetical protein